MSLSRRLRAWRDNWLGGSSSQPPALRVVRPPERSTATRRSSIEPMEQRNMMTADPIWLGGVYIEADGGTDQHGDLFYVSFQGGAEGTKLAKLTFDTDQNAAGYGVADNFFDTIEAGYGADHAFNFQIEKLQTANPNAKVNASVTDGGMKLVLTFENFQAGDLLVFTIDVDEIQHFNPSETNLDVINGGIDPITSGVEFQGSKLIAQFEAPSYENVDGQAEFINAYDSKVDPAKVNVPRDNDDGKRDRSAGTAIKLQQVPKPISLAGTVYVDNNMNLVQEGSEQGLAGVQLDLWRKEGSTYVNTGFKTTTDSQGHYRFGTDLKLMPGTYQVRETQPVDYMSVGAVPGSIPGVGTVGQIVANDKDVLTEITIAKGDQHAVNLDFAEVQPVEISGHVCLALPGFDCFSTEPNSKAPLADVQIDLVDLNGVVLKTTKTLADGSYKFSGLPAGVYTLVEHTPAQYIDGGASAGTIQGKKVGTVANPSKITQVVMTPGTSGVNYDFCEYTPGSISGHVYEDKNDDGSRQPSEPFIPGVVIKLLDASGSMIAQTTTDSQGFYRFSNLGPGTYCIVEVQPQGYLDGKDAAGTIQGKRVGTSDPNGDKLADIVLPSGRDGINYDFGELRDGSISGKVFVDFDGDCEKDPIDQPLSGVTVQLLNERGDVIAETKTIADGTYQFNGLRPGKYWVREIQPVGYLQGGTKAGSAGGDTLLQDNIRQIPIGSGDRLVDYDFCETPPAELSGHVFIDSNGDCLIQPNEKGIGGVRVDLLDASGNILQTTFTAADGTYSFKQLAPGNYAVREWQPVGYYQGGQRAGSKGGDASVVDLISVVPILAGDKLVDYDFCEVQPSALQGKVFVDRDFDCVQDTDEEPLIGVQIDLLDADGKVISTTQTDALGQYRFENLTPGKKYSVRENQPKGYFQGGQMAPSGRANTAIEDRLVDIVLASGEVLTDLDFCEVPPAKISGYVFQDGPVLITPDGLVPSKIRPFRDGQLTSDDTRLAGVWLELKALTGASIDPSRMLPGYYSGNSIRVRTDANGYFEFDGLRAGSYHIFQVQPEGYVDSLDTPGPLASGSVNPEDQDPVALQYLRLLAIEPANHDAILQVSIDPGQHAQSNNFSEIRVDKPILPPPPNPPKPPELPPTPPAGFIPPPFETNLVFGPLGNPEPPPLISGGIALPYSWHLSIVNAGAPRGVRIDKSVSREQIVRATTILDVTRWTVVGMNEGKWTIVSQGPKAKGISSKNVFNIAGAKALAGDFNGDGIDELALYMNGEWLLDVNGNGRWDNDDLWAKLGGREDLPVVGDWDADGKDDIGIFGPEWQGDRFAIEHEPGLPDPDNQKPTRPKNIPPRPDEAPNRERLMQRNPAGTGRADLVDHIFRFGEAEDQAVAGDFNGDGIATVGVFRNGKWRLDIDGDGKFTKRDGDIQFGEGGDTALTGDFDGDGTDEIAIARGNQVIVDSNHNGMIDVTDKVFEIEEGEGQVVVGDFDGDGSDEPALHRSTRTTDVPLQARRN